MSAFSFYFIFTLCSSGCGWWLVLICCERKVLLDGWWLAAGAGLVCKKNTVSWLQPNRVLETYIS